MMKYGTAHFIRNVDAEVYVLIIDEITLPVAVPRDTDTNCYVCSPTAHYVDYARYESGQLKNSPLRFVLHSLLNFLSVWAQIGEIERVVYVNNWFLSTNLYPLLTEEQITQITDLIKTSFPDHVIIMRSLNRYTNYSFINTLQQIGYQRIVSRQIYVTNHAIPTYRKKKDFKNDLKFLDRTDRKVIYGSKLDDNRLARVLKLYNDLYLDKYTHLNPQFSIEFMRLVHDHNLMTFLAVSNDTGDKEEVFDAVLGYFRREGQMTTPIFGYDTAKPSSAGLYRLLSTLLVLESERFGCILNQSSGASKFKRTRGCTPLIEYSLFYSDHTTKRQKLGWKVLKNLINAIAEPVMVRNQLQRYSRRSLRLVLTKPGLLLWQISTPAQTIHEPILPECYGAESFTED